MNDATRARKIAELIAGCDTDHRGELLTTVADELRADNQHRTADLIEFAAKSFERSRGYAPPPGHP